jgi:NitT/TauT family transport system substrate-binding protein
VTKHSEEGSFFRSRKFTDWPTVKEALIAREVGAVFLLAPMAMQLRSDGVPVKVVYLGHRDGTALIVGKDSDIGDFGDLRGKTIAIPSRFANQNILMHKMMKEWKMPFDSIELRELPPPEHPTALLAGSIDGYIVGEPFCAKAEMEGYGRVLMQMRDAWPNFISCVLVVRQDLIEHQRPWVQELVNGIAASGKWLDEDRDTGAQHRHDAAIVAGKMFYNQPPKLLEYVLTKDVTRVSYTNLAPRKESFDEIMDLAVEMAILPRRLAFEEYFDTSFLPDLEKIRLDMDRLPDVQKVADQ